MVTTRTSTLLRGAAMVRHTQVPPPTGPPATGTWLRPAIGSSWEWQLGAGSLDESVPAQVYDIDMEDQSAATVARIKNAHKCFMIAYISAGTAEAWRSDYSSFPGNLKGPELADWPDEYWLDTRAYTAIRPLMAARADRAKAKGFDGIEWDNVDAWAQDENVGFPLTAAHQIVYNKMLADVAHERGMAAFLKNDTDQCAALQPFFDGLIVEEAYKFNEASSYAAFTNAGKPTFATEYPSTGKLTTAQKADANTRNWALTANPPLLDGPRRDANKTADGPVTLVTVSS